MPHGRQHRGAQFDILPGFRRRVAPGTDQLPADRVKMEEGPLILPAFPAGDQVRHIAAQRYLTQLVKRLDKLRRTLARFEQVQAVEQ